MENVETFHIPQESLFCREYEPGDWYGFQGLREPEQSGGNEAIEQDSLAEGQAEADDIFEEAFGLGQESMEDMRDAVLSRGMQIRKMLMN